MTRAWLCALAAALIAATLVSLWLTAQILLRSNR